MKKLTLGIVAVLAALFICACIFVGCMSQGSTDYKNETFTGSWQSTDKYDLGGGVTYTYVIDFKENGVCTETDTWSDGSKSNWVGTWEKTGDGKYRYELGHMYKLSDDKNRLTDSYGYVLVGGKVTGKWTEEDKSRGTYLEYVFNNDAKGTRTLFKSGGEVAESLTFSWTKPEENVYKVYYAEPSYTNLEFVESGILHDVDHDQYLKRV